VAQVLTLISGIGAALDEPVLAAARATLREAGPTIAGVQLCDGPAAPPPWDRLRHEALNERLPPGEGAFDLAGFVRAVPVHLPLGVEVLNPAAQGAAGPAAWARRCRDATRALLAGL